MLTQILGIDLSLASTGLAWDELDSGRVPCTMYVKTKACKPDYGSKLERFHTIADSILGVVWGEHTGWRTSVFLEGPSYASKGAATHDIAGNWWLLYSKLIVCGVDVTVVPPAIVKAYATGKGNANKDEVLAAAIKRYGDVDIPGNDIADAVVLLAIGSRMLGFPLEESMPKTHLRAFEKWQAGR